jgi:predicted DNA-binding ribbon-helix-helix protein
MTINADRGPMMSRSVRLHKDTLDKLQKLADDKGIGITVLMRRIMEERVNRSTGAIPDFSWTRRSVAPE